MYKKSLIILSVFFAVLFITNFSFANMDANNVKNAVNSGTNTVVDGADKLGSSIRNGIGNAENGIEDALTMDNNTMANDTLTAQSAISTGNNYSLTRTANAATTDTTNIWVWIALAVVAVTIVGLVWYYVRENNQ